jgi:hypothetical protein
VFVLAEVALEVLETLLGGRADEVVVGVGIGEGVVVVVAVGGEAQVEAVDGGVGWPAELAVHNKIMGWQKYRSRVGLNHRPFG